MIRTIIPSKDRACQLDLLLRSIKEFWTDWGDQTIIVLWRASAPEYEATFKTLRNEHPEFIYIEEEEFRPDCQKLATTGDEGYLQFMVDDDVLVRPFSLEDDEFKHFAEDPNITTLSLRMNPRMDYCFTENVKTGAPWFRADGAWYWPGLQGDWGYPNSVDGNIWRRVDVRQVFSGGKWDMLHELEPALRYGMCRPLALCYQDSRLLNIANNTVQDTVAANRHGGGDHVEMNKRYAVGERLALEPITKADPPSPHFLMEYEWK